MRGKNPLIPLSISSRKEQANESFSKRKSFTVFSLLHSHKKALLFGTPEKGYIALSKPPPTRLCLFELSASLLKFYYLKRLLEHHYFIIWNSINVILSNCVNGKTIFNNFFNTRRCKRFELVV